MLQAWCSLPANFGHHDILVTNEVRVPHKTNSENCTALSFEFPKMGAAWCISNLPAPVGKSLEALVDTAFRTLENKCLSDYFKGIKATYENMFKCGANAQSQLDTVAQS